MSNVQKNQALRERPTSEDPFAQYDPAKQVSDQVSGQVSFDSAVARGQKNADNAAERRKTYSQLATKDFKIENLTPETKNLNPEAKLVAFQAPPKNESSQQAKKESPQAKATLIAANAYDNKTTNTVGGATPGSSVDSKQS